jgi:hypothetical protein
MGLGTKRRQQQTADICKQQSCTSSSSALFCAILRLDFAQTLIEKMLLPMAEPNSPSINFSMTAIDF